MYILMAFLIRNIGPCTCFLSAPAAVVAAAESGKGDIATAAMTVTAAGAMAATEAGRRHGAPLLPTTEVVAVEAEEGVAAPGVTTDPDPSHLVSIFVEKVGEKFWDKSLLRKVEEVVTS
jgi:hypothetical protein